MIEANVFLQKTFASIPLYEPAIAKVRATLNKEGVLYVGDSKMSASKIRASIVNHNDYYLVPLPATIISNEILDNYIEPIINGTQTLIEVYRDLPNGSSKQIAEGYEYSSSCEASLDDEIIRWNERLLIICSLKHAKAQEDSLRKRLNKASTKIEDLINRRRGKKTFNSKAELEAAITDILRTYQVKSLLDVNISETIVERQIRSYGDRPARTESEVKFSLSVSYNDIAINAAINRLGWRVYATNTSSDYLSLTDAVLAYREQYILERSFGRLKGQPLSLTPMYLQRDDHATGLIRLLSIGLRVLTLLEFVVRRNLSGASIAGLYPSNKNRFTYRPTAELILAAFKNINLTIIKDDENIYYHITHLSDLQQHLLDLLDFPENIYFLDNDFF
jgi:transposase